jgi:glycosyltransferase involved in cell wall biosynthesis
VPRKVARSATWSGIPDAAFVLYTIAPWTARKGLDATVRAYQTAFSGREDTLLVIKSSPLDYTRPQWHVGGQVSVGTAPWALAHVLSEFERPAPVQLVTSELSDEEIDALHARADCYLSLCRSEGWGIPPFDAAAWGNPVVITGFGGQREYLDDESAFLVDFELVDVDDPSGGASYTPDQRWAEPSIEHAAMLLRQVLADPGEAATRASRARKRVLREFDAPVVAAELVRALSRL